VSHVAAPAPGRFAPPPELADYVNEIFYAPLSTHLANHDLSDELGRRLDAYRNTKLALQDELRAELEKIPDNDAPTRQRALEAFARQQTPHLAALEQQAESLRADLATDDVNWSALREWTLGEANTRGDSPAEISGVMRAAAFYQKGLSAGQRRLLREIAIEIAMAADSTASAQAVQPFLFFPPEPARVLLPEELPAEVAAQVAAYQTKKSALKKELYDAVYAQDRALLGLLRTSGLKSLAGRQAARLAELDALADQIRSGLAQLPQPSRAVGSSPLPESLTRRIAAVLDSRATLQKETIAKAEEIRRRIAGQPLQLSYGFEHDGLKFIVVPRRAIRSQPSEATRTLIDSVQTEMAAVADDYGRRFADIANESESIRADATALLGDPGPKVVDTALAGAARVAALRDSEAAYRDYRLAVFEPGLSPEQRRLLFDAAIKELDLPLPRGELQPTVRAPSW